MASVSFAEAPAEARNAKVVAGRGFGITFARVRSRWGRVGKVVRGLARSTILAKADREAFLAGSQQVLDKAQAGSVNVKLEVEDEEELSQLTILRQGDASFYTPHMLGQRRAIRTSPALMDAVQRWFNWLPRTVLNPITQVKEMSKATYCAMVAAVYQVLMKMFSIDVDADLDYDPSEDWDHDCQGQETMDYPMLFDAMFELADHWCETTIAADYAGLLDQLLDKVKILERDGTFGKLLSKYRNKYDKGPVRPVTQRQTSISGSANRAQAE